jgi:hypothetical protein
VGKDAQLVLRAPNSAYTQAKARQFSRVKGSNALRAVGFIPPRMHHGQAIPKIVDA